MSISYNRYFSLSKDPYADIEWENKDALILDDSGKPIFELKDVKTPKSWSQTALNIVASKYFLGTKQKEKTLYRETSIQELIDRVSKEITIYGINQDYFNSVEDSENFQTDLAWLCVHQYGSFNSPVWFNVGIKNYLSGNSKKTGYYGWNNESKTVKEVNSIECPQTSACFISSIEDSLEDIMNLASIKAKIFKYGSGIGVNLSPLRSSFEELSGGGIPSGPVSYMKIFDQVGGVIKSGGKTRRSAIMQILNVDHPDIIKFIQVKSLEDVKAKALIEQGYDSSFNGEAYNSVFFQNSNLSVRVTNKFMEAVENNLEFETLAVTSKDVINKSKAKNIMNEIAKGAYLCGDPGIQFHDTINDWHTCKNSGPINASNPCSEYMSIDDSACNLASLNLLKFVDEKGEFNVERFKKAIEIFTIAMDILIDSSSFPTFKIAKNVHEHRQLGLGYSNVGAFLFYKGLPYDSEEGRDLIAAISAIMTGTVYKISSYMAKKLGSFAAYEKNSKSMLNVIKKHRQAVLSESLKPDCNNIWKEAVDIWNDVLKFGEICGFRNSQATVLAPTGTIGFMMDCLTTGIEPMLSLVVYKSLSGGGVLKLTNSIINITLEKLGYSEEKIDKVLKYLDQNGTIESPDNLINPKHLEIFDCALKPEKGVRFISYMAHIKMMASVQPFISGAISKTVNLSNNITIDEIADIYNIAWKLNLKSIAVYRDGSKGVQPLSTSLSLKDKQINKQIQTIIYKNIRHKLPETRNSITHKFDIAGHVGYLTVSKYPNGTPGELFITMAKEGSTIGGLMNSFGIAISLGLQYGVPIDVMCKKFIHTCFEPSGMTTNKDIKFAKSIVDYIFKYLEKLIKEEVLLTEPEEMIINLYQNPIKENRIKYESSGPTCQICGSLMYRNGTCFLCNNCGSSSGCS